MHCGPIANKYTIRYTIAWKRCVPGRMSKPSQLIRSRLKRIYSGVGRERGVQVAAVGSAQRRGGSCVRLRQLLRMGVSAKIYNSYFMHGDDYAGISAFINRSDIHWDRNARMLSVGALVPLDNGRLGRSWKHAEKLKELAESVRAICYSWTGLNREM